MLKVLGVINDVLLGLVKVCANLLQLTVFLLEFIQQDTHGVCSDTLIQRLDLLTMPLLYPGYALNAFLKVSTQSFDLFLDLESLVLGQFIEFLVTDDFAIAKRGKDVASWRLQHGNPFLRGSGLQRLPLLCNFTLGLFLDGP